MDVSQGFVGGTYHKRLASEDVKNATLTISENNHIRENPKILLKDCSMV